MKKEPTRAEKIAELVYILFIIASIVFLPADRIFGYYREHKAAPAANRTVNKTALTDNAEN